MGGKGREKEGKGREKWCITPSLYVSTVSTVASDDPLEHRPKYLIPKCEV